MSAASRKSPGINLLAALKLEKFFFRPCYLTIYKFKIFCIINYTMSNLFFCAFSVIIFIRNNEAAKRQKIILVLIDFTKPVIFNFFQLPSSTLKKCSTSLTQPSWNRLGNEKKIGVFLCSNPIKLSMPCIGCSFSTFIIPLKPNT